MNYNFHRTLLADAHSKHILIILVIYLQNFRKLQEWFSEFERDENKTQKRKSNRLLIKRWNFSSMSILKPQNSISWIGSIRNQIMLFCLYNMTKKHELLLLSSKGSLKVQLNPNQTHVCCVCKRMAKLCTYILYKSISLRNVIKEKHHSREGVQSFTMEFHQVSEKSYLQHTSQYLLI